LFGGRRRIEGGDNDELRLELQPDGHQERKDVTPGGCRHERGERDEDDAQKREDLSGATHICREQYTPAPLLTARDTFHQQREGLPEARAADTRATVVPQPHDDEIV
jgi:hypothetical protein